MKIAILGTIDESHSKVSGQYDRTEIIRDGLVDVGYNVEFVNMNNYKEAPLITFVKFIKVYFSCDAFLFLASVNGSRFILRCLNLLKKIENKKIFQIAIGGWGNYSYIENQPIYRNILKSITGVFVETEAMRSIYANNGIEHVYYLPNCKHIRSYKLPDLTISNNSTFKFCTYSRITPIKGIAEAVNTVKYLNEKYGDSFCTLDIYGTCLEEDRNWFDELKNQFTPQIVFKGKIDRKNSLSVLSQYDMMLFYTTHTGEGVPGAVIDCYEAGVPIAVCDISNMKDIVHDGVTGFVFEPYSYMSMVEKVELFCKQMNPMERYEMRKRCVKEARKYDIDNVIDIIVQYLNA